MTKTITITRQDGQLVIGTEDRITNLPANRILVAIVDKYGDERQLALTDDEIGQVCQALGHAALRHRIDTAPQAITPEFQRFLDTL